MAEGSEAEPEGFFDSEDEVEMVDEQDGVILDPQEDGTFAKLSISDQPGYPAAAAAVVGSSPAPESASAEAHAGADQVTDVDKYYESYQPPLAPPVPPQSHHVRTGYLMKEGGSYRSWKRRYFVLTFTSRLEYYEGQGGKKINEVQLGGAQVIIPVVSKKPFCFHIFALPPSLSGSGNKRSKYVLCAESEEDRDAWVRDIRLISETTPNAMSLAPSGFLQKVAAIASTNVIRQLVSKKKIRYQNYGYDLDLTYLPSRLIAMGFPAEGAEAVYRNRYEDVYRLLEQFHARHYKVYNLCSERAYPPNRFHNRVAIYPFEDHNVPTLEMISCFCSDVQRWLSADESNVAVVHCKAGKGRTGLMICCYLLHSGEAANADEALKTYAELRTEDHKGVTNQCQLQYVRYYERVVQRGLPPRSRRLLRSIVMHTTPNFDPTGGCNPYFTLHKEWELIFCSKPPDNDVPYVKNSELLEFRVDVIVTGDIKVDFYDQDKLSSDDGMFYVWFNTAFVPEDGRLRLERDQIDRSSKDKKMRKFDEKFALELVFVPIP